jgi:hypothetical protein
LWAVGVRLLVVADVDVDVDVVVSEGQSLGILVGEDFFRLAVSNESKVNSIFAM